MKFCVMVDIRDVITYVKFGDDRLMGLAVAGGQILAFPIDIDRRPYNTPCDSKHSSFYVSMGLRMGLSVSSCQTSLG